MQAQQSPNMITIDNQASKPVYAAVYCEPILFGSHLAREFEPIEVGIASQEPIMRPKRSSACRRHLVFAYSPAKLEKQISEAQFKNLEHIGIGYTTGGRLFDYFYVIEKDGVLKSYNPLSYLGSGRIRSFEEFAQTQAARLVVKDSVLIQENPFKNTQAKVRVGKQLCPDEKIYVDERRQYVKEALSQLCGQELSGSYVPTIAAINSGGGARAMTCMLGFHLALQNTKALNAIMYDVGLSGGAWFISLWMNSRKTLAELKNHIRSQLKLGSSIIIDVGSRPLSAKERAQIVDALLVRAAIKQPVTLVNVWGALLATRYLYGPNPQAKRLSLMLSGNYPSRYPFPIFTAINAYGYDDTIESRMRMNWYEFTPYEVGGVGNWLGDAFVPTWAFGRKFENGLSQNFNPEYDLGLLMGIWGSAFAVSYARVYEELLPVSGGFERVLKFAREKLDDSWVMFQEKRISVAKAHNFTKNLSNAPYKGMQKLLMADAGIVFNLPYPPVSGHGARKADILLFFDASESINEHGSDALKRAEQYAFRYGLKFPKIPEGQALAEATKKPFAIFKHETDPEVPLVIYVSHYIDRSAITYHSSISKEFDSDFSTFKLRYSPQEFDQLCLVAQQNLEQSMDKIKEAIRWKIAQRGGFAA